jgi:hypothetical protein
MAQLKNSVKVNITGGGIGRIAASTDWYTGLIFDDTTPAGFGTDIVKRIYSLAQAESYGITVAAYPVAHYHISEFFRVAQKLNVNLWIDVQIDAITTYTGVEIYNLQKFRNGELKTIGVYLQDDYASTIITGSQTYAEQCDSEGMPVNVIVACNFASFSAATDKRALNSEYVSVCIAQDGAGDGLALFESEDKSITVIGAELATIAAAKVHENIGWVEKFNIVGSTELTKLCLCDGTAIETLTNAEIDALNDKGHTLMVYRPVAGAYFYDAPTCTLITSDFANIESVRAIQKAKRLINAALQPYQNSPLYIDATTGKLDENTIITLEKTCDTSLDVMLQAPAEISGKSITINPDQNVLQTSQLQIVAKIVPVGVGREIIVTLGYTTNI